MKQALNSIVFLMISLLLFSFAGCAEKENPAADGNALRIIFQHRVGDQDVVFNDMRYTNAAGNPYEVREIMYFISDLRLYKDGVAVNPAQWDDLHYVDSKISETLGWLVGNNVPAGVYDSLTFTFGLSQERNKSFLFVNPPEVGMAWPEVLGGGYHYMMMNGFWSDTMQVRQPFNFHLGIGQIYENNSGEVSDITAFVHNNFTVSPAGPAITINPGQQTTINLCMDIASWFETPVVFDFNEWGGAIMQNQQAMHTACLNGKDAFSYDIGPLFINE